MRDTKELSQSINGDEMVIFNEFKDNLKKLMDSNGVKLYVLRDYIVIPYIGGFLEVYYYDYPRNPVIRDGFLEFEYSIIGETRKIEIKLV